MPPPTLKAMTSSPRKPKVPPPPKAGEKVQPPEFYTLAPAMGPPTSPMSPCPSNAGSVGLPVMSPRDNYQPTAVRSRAQSVAHDVRADGVRNESHVTRDGEVYRPSELAAILQASPLSERLSGQAYLKRLTERTTAETLRWTRLSEEDDVQAKVDAFIDAIIFQYQAWHWLDTAENQAPSLTDIRAVVWLVWKQLGMDEGERWEDASYMIEHPSGYIQNPYAAELTPEQRFAARREHQPGQGLPPPSTHSRRQSAASVVIEDGLAITMRMVEGLQEGFQEWFQTKAF
ncbi:MAG: hypothetical protein L6R40_006253 [Gallowayella cf. fulva]|nr:MAG: hypothetical protein L6R40_006253 [Xanthomendoza cf. fulva]